MKDVLEYEDVPDPFAGPGEVVVRVHAVTVNRTLDCLVRQGGARNAPDPRQLRTNQGL